MLKYILAGASALALATGAAVAQQTPPTPADASTPSLPPAGQQFSIIDQTGDNNTAIVDQQAAGEGQSTIIQENLLFSGGPDGDPNGQYANVQQSSDFGGPIFTSQSNVSSIRQIGSGEAGAVVTQHQTVVTPPEAFNNVEIDQETTTNGAPLLDLVSDRVTIPAGGQRFNAVAVADQTGDSNDILISQQGASNDAYVNQEGSTNDADVTQTGASGPSLGVNDADVSQVGDLNVADVFQSSEATDSVQTASVTQTETLNTAFVTQTTLATDAFGNKDAIVVQNGTDGLADINQSGGGQYADVLQTGLNESAFVTQLGTGGNVAVIDQLLGLGGNTVDLIQNGADNNAGSNAPAVEAGITQSGGLNNSVLAEQFGDNNTLTTNQIDGESNSITISQAPTATNNTADALQTGGSLLESLIFQDGDGNSATTDQTGENNSSLIVQAGLGNSADVFQSINDGVSEIFQDGSSNSATVSQTVTNASFSLITQIGSGNVANVTQ